MILAAADGRAAGRLTLEREIGSALPAGGARDADEALATAAAASLAGGWGSVALAELGSADEGAQAKAMAGVPELLDGRVRRTAATETARAFNDERDDILILLGGGELEGRVPPHDVVQPGLFKVWSAVLDRVTCAACFGMDGTVLEAAKTFKSGPPPLHPNCRCVVEHVIIPKPERLEDIAIDYDLFKQELVDVIRERREISDRQALRFVTESLGTKRSPSALTKRFANEPYATRR